MRRAIIFLLEQKEPVLLEDEIKRQSQLYPWTVERLAVAERLRGTFVVVVRGQRSHPEVTRRPKGKILRAEGMSWGASTELYQEAGDIMRASLTCLLDRYLSRTYCVPRIFLV